VPFVSPSSPHVPAPTVRFRVIAWLVIALVRLFRWRIRTAGIDNVPAEQGAVITWNHVSHIDFVCTVWDVYRQLGRPVRYVAKAELWQDRVFGWVPRFADAIPVARTNGDDRDRALADAVAALQAGHLVMVAPEGTISESLEPMPFRTGAARMAQLAGVPLVPSVSWGSQRLTTTGRRARRREAFGIPVEIAFGEPLRPEPDDDPVEVTADLHHRTTKLLHRVQDRYPDGAPAGAWWVPARLGGGAPAPPADQVAVRRRPEDAA
jgi:1-acyl-sn-glycerol-3-phosphate acyltransferase